MNIGSGQRDRQRLAGTGRWLPFFAASLLVLPACQHTSGTAPPADNWTLPFAFETGTQEGEVTVREDTEVEIRYRKPYQSPPRLVLVELRGSQAFETQYSKEDFQIVGQGATYFRLRNNHSERGASWATIKWHAEGTLAKANPTGTTDEPEQAGQTPRTQQEIVINRVKNFGGKVGIDPTEQTEPDAASQLVKTVPNKEPGKPIDVTLASVTDPRLRKNAVVTIDLHRTKVSDTDLAQLEGLKSLRSLNLYGTKVTDQGLASLAGLTNLQTLYLNDSRITDAGLANLQGLKKLSELGLNQTRVTDQGLASLAGLTNLHSLSLVGTQITDGGLQQLKALRGLKHLYVGHTKVTAGGIEELKRSLPQTQILK